MRRRPDHSPSNRPELPEIERLQAVELRPGDMLIANVDRGALATPETIDAVKQALEDEFPGHEVLVLAGIDILVGRKPEEGDAHRAGAPIPPPRTQPEPPAPPPPPFRRGGVVPGASSARPPYWSLDSALAGSEKLDMRLGAGWEPFAATTDSDGAARIWLRHLRQPRERRTFIDEGIGP